ncbi:hypothetical protein PV327_003866 [Microctonus hyperodae]|uniref:DUF7041 domain-containing protein n=1 Tax=Microctonus hyperodae TaxID=165561 RepID=A0AA39G6G8_MICHY|nr:hypothetical protein PV327_003866 [Microctonus hyperodae]
MQSLDTAEVGESTRIHDQSTLDMTSDTQPPVIGVIECINFMPRFWKKLPYLWFTHVEHMFNHYRFTDDSSKYDAVLSRLDFETMKQLHDVLENPPATHKYANLKIEMISRFGDSLECQPYKLLSKIQLGDKKPSRLLRLMTVLAGSCISEDVVRTRWLALLPQLVQRYLEFVPQLSLQEVAELADELLEELRNSAVTSKDVVSCRVCSTSPPPSDIAVANIVSELSEMKLCIAEMTTLIKGIDKSLNNHLAYQPKQHRERSRARSRRRSSSMQSSTSCYYHQRFGAKARQCEQPCSYNQPVPKKLTIMATTQGDDDSIYGIKQSNGDYRLRIYDRGTKLNFLVVSGSDNSLMPKSAINTKDRLEPCDSDIFAANGSVIRTYGKKLFTLELGVRRCFKWEFVIADVSEAILGADFLEYYGLSVDLKRGRLIDPSTLLAT